MFKAGYDLDGTICEEPFISKGEKILYKLFGEFWDIIRKDKCLPYFIPPKDKFIIISARSQGKYRRKYTEKWLKRHGIFPNKLVMPILPIEDPEMIASYKAEMCRIEGVKIYYENNEEIGILMKKFFPELEIGIINKGIFIKSITI